MIKKINKVILFMLDTIEIYIPTICITITFISFLIQIFTRYVLRDQVEWSYEVTLIGFLWCLILSASNGSRTETHVAFTLFYDKLSNKNKLIIRLIANAVVITTFSLLLYPAWEFVSFMQIKKTSVLKIPINIVYFPFIVFTFLTLVHVLQDFIEDIYSIIKKQEKHSKGVLDE